MNLSLSSFPNCSSPRNSATFNCDLLGVLLVPPPVNDGPSIFLDFVLIYMIWKFSWELSIQQFHVSLTFQINRKWCGCVALHYSVVLTQPIFLKNNSCGISNEMCDPPSVYMITRAVTLCYGRCSCLSVFVVKWISMFKDLLSLYWLYHLFIFRSECHCSIFCMNKLSCQLSAE